MRLMSLAVACLLFAQEQLPTSASEPPVSPVEAPTPATGVAPRSIQAVPVRPNARLLTPEGLVEEAIALSATDEIPGRPLSLLDALANVRKQSERLNVVHAYWQLTLALATHGVALGESIQLARVNADTAGADVSVEEARLAVIGAQRSLADAARLPAGVPLPLPSDRPLVRRYKTRFDEIFSSSVPPERMRLIDRKLPIQLRTIDVRASAVQAADDALEGMTGLYQKGECDLQSVAAAVHELARQHRAYLETVGDYNRGIANYALNIVGQEITGRQLVATLIDLDRRIPHTEPNQGGATETHFRSGVQRAEFTAPLSEDQEGFWEPTLAAERPSRIDYPDSDRGRPSTLPPRETTEDDSTSDGEETGTGVPAAESTRAEDLRAEIPSYARLPLVPVPRTVFRIPLEGETAQYPDLVGAEPAIQAGRIATGLFPDQGDAVEDSQPVGLRSCLADQSVEECHRLIDAYWLARLRACEYQTFVDRSRHLEGLAPIALGRTSEPSGPEDMLRLRAMRLSADATVHEAHARLLEAQYELTLAAGGSLDSAWLLPRTSPRWGPFPLRLQSQPRSMVESWPIRRLTVAIPVFSQIAMLQASKVVEADVARSDAAYKFTTGDASLDVAMTAIQRQNNETLAFLDTVTLYNQAIAEYAARTNAGATSAVFDRILEPVDSP